MTPLSITDLDTLHTLYRSLRHGDGLTQTDMDALAREWEPKILPSHSQRVEMFALCDVYGSPTAVRGPRWLFHLLGLRHRAVDVAFSTEAGLIIIQRRSPHKENWPGAWDMAVAGHVPQRADGAPVGFEDAAWKEIEEEVGLAQSEADQSLLECGLEPVGDPYFCLEANLDCNPPFFDAEVRQIFAATLSGYGLARIHFADNEVAGILLITPESAWRLLREETIASGLRYSLPRYLDWLVKQQSTE